MNVIQNDVLLADCSGMIGASKLFSGKFAPLIIVASHMETK